MRSLPPALLDLARAGGGAPLARLELMDLTPHYAPLFASGPIGRNAATMARDGAVIQAYLDGADAARPIYARRVADPTAASWGAWTAIATGADLQAGVALALLDDRLRLLCQDGATTAVRAADSFDDGATWTAPATLFDPRARLAALTACGTVGTVFVAYATGGGAWRVAAWSLGDAWRSADWTNGDLRVVAGLHAARRDDGSYLLALAARTDGVAGTALSVCVYAGTWSAPLTLVPPDASASDVGGGVGLRIAEPRLGRYDGGYHLAYSVVDESAPSPLAAARVALMRSTDGVHWSDPLEDAATYAYGATPLRVPAGYLLAAPDAAALAPAYAGTLTQYADLSPALSRLEVVQKDGAPARLVVTVANDGHLLSLPALRPNATLRLALGYAGAGVITTGLYFIDDWSHVRAADEDEIVITASDRAAWLDRQSRTTLLYTGQTVEWLVREVAARAGLPPVDVPATAQFAYTVPVFAIPAGSSWRAALARLGRLYGFDAAMRVAAGGADALVLCEKSPADRSAWSYGSLVERLVTARGLDHANHVVVFGAAGVTGEAWDWPGVADTGQERYLHAIETLITTADGARLRAALDLRREVRLECSGSLSAPLHPGLELWDVIAVGDAPATVALRIATLHYIYEPHPGTYDMALTLEGV